MTINRGDVVLVDFPFAGGGGSKVRPALVVQNDRDNHRLANAIVAMITSRTGRAAEPTQTLVEVGTPDGSRTGLLMDSVVNCANLFTVDRRRLVRVIGSLPPSLMSRVERSLKAALDLP